MTRLTALLAATTLALAACSSVAPKFEAPAVDVPAQFKQLSPAERGNWKVAQPAESAPRGEWWTAFRDPVLDRLVAEATAASPTLRAAAARVTQARAIAGVVAADGSPQINAGFGPTRTRPSAASQNLPAGTPMPAYTIWRGLVSASYEVDLFGRVADSIAAARSDLAATEAILRSMQLALQADLAQVYFALRATDEELRQLRETIGLREQSLQLVTRRFELGDIGEFDVTRSRAELSSVRSETIALERQRTQFEHALATLLGKTPAAFGLDTAAFGADPPAIPAGLPSVLLERRPDIAAAQRAMAAANARIGVAKSAFFPSLRLTAQGGLESAELGDLFNWSSRTWALGPLFGTLLTLPLLDGGRNQAGVERAVAVLEESVADYRQRVLVAFGEVENSLVAVRTLKEQSEAVRDTVTAAARALTIAEARYRAGASGFLEVLDAQRTLLAALRAQAQLQGARSIATVSLIRALGGGWDAPSH